MPRLIGKFLSRNLSRKYLAVCITPSNSPAWLLPNVPFFCLFNPKHFPREQTRERIDFLAGLWNDCYEQALDKFPESTHIIHTGTYYVPQARATQELVSRYEELDADVILSGNVWGRFEESLVRTYRTYDPW